MPTPTEADDFLKQSIQLLWGSQEPGKRGPKPRLSVEKIAAAGVAVADREGLAALSMQRVAAELGYTAMSLYTYIPSKELLVTVITDAATGPPPVLIGDSWRDKVECWASAAWGHFRAHPWVLQVPMVTPPTGPNELSWFDSLLGAIAESGLPPNETLSVSVYLLCAVRELARLSSSTDERKTNAPPFVEILSSLIDPQRFPALSAIAAVNDFGRNAQERDDEPLFSFGMQRMLDGVEVHVARHR